MIWQEESLADTSDRNHPDSMKLIQKIKQAGYEQLAGNDNPEYGRFLIAVHHDGPSAFGPIRPRANGADSPPCDNLASDYK